jgi:hypothetical protein
MLHLRWKKSAPTGKKLEVVSGRNARCLFLAGFNASSGDFSAFAIAMAPAQKARRHVIAFEANTTHDHPDRSRYRGANRGAAHR